MNANQVKNILSSSKIDLNDFREEISQEFEILSRMSEDQSQLLRKIIQAKSNDLFRLKSELHDGPLRNIESENKKIRQFLRTVNNLEIEKAIEIYLIHTEDQLRNIRNIILGRIDSVDQEEIELITEMRAVIRGKKKILNGTKNIFLKTNFISEEQNEFFVQRKICNLICCFIKETIENAINHGDANTVEIIVNENDEHILSIASDDGKGFQFPLPSKNIDFQKLANSGKLGLHLLRSEVLTLHGSFKVISRKNGAGSIIKITIPK